MSPLVCVSVPPVVKGVERANAAVGILKWLVVRWLELVSQLLDRVAPHLKRTLAAVGAAG